MLTEGVSGYAWHTTKPTVTVACVLSGEGLHVHRCLMSGSSVKIVCAVMATFTDGVPLSVQVPCTKGCEFELRHDLAENLQAPSDRCQM